MSHVEFDDGECVPVSSSVIFVNVVLCEYSSHVFPPFWSLLSKCLGPVTGRRNIDRHYFASYVVFLDSTCTNLNRLFPEHANFSTLKVVC